MRNTNGKDDMSNAPTMNLPVNHGQPWTDESSAGLRALFERGLALDEIAEKLGRTPGAICGQLERLKLVVNFGGVYHRLEQRPWADLRRKSVG